MVKFRVLVTMSQGNETQTENRKPLRNTPFPGESKLALFSFDFGDDNITIASKGKKRFGLSQMWRNLHDVNSILRI